MTRPTECPPGAGADEYFSISGVRSASTRSNPPIQSQEEVSRAYLDSWWIEEEKVLFVSHGDKANYYRILPPNGRASKN